MIKKIILHVVLLFSLISCYFEKSIDYKKLKPYIEVDKTNKEVFENININEYISLLEKKKNFICFFYSSTCPYCEKLVENLINPYIKKSKNLVYGVDVYSEENYKDLEIIEKYQPDENDYFYYKNGAISIIRPLTKIVENGKIIAYEKGYSYRVLDMINGYII